MASPWGDGKAQKTVDPEKCGRQNQSDEPSRKTSVAVLQSAVDGRMGYGVVATTFRPGRARRYYRPAGSHMFALCRDMGGAFRDRGPHSSPP